MISIYFMGSFKTLVVCSFKINLKIECFILTTFKCDAGFSNKLFKSALKVWFINYNQPQNWLFFKFQPSKNKANINDKMISKNLVLKTNLASYK